MPIGLIAEGSASFLLDINSHHPPIIYEQVFPALSYSSELDVGAIFPTATLQLSSNTDFING